MNFNILKLLILLLFTTTISYTQETNWDSRIVIDSLYEYSFTHLQEEFYRKEISHPKLSSLIARTYLKKAKARKDTIKIAHGYKLLSYISEKGKALNYADSIITLTENSDHISFPTLGYLLKGFYLYESGDYEESLQNYLLAYPYAIEKNNLDDQIQVQTIIASLKNRWGKYDEALTIYKSILKKLKNESAFREQNRNLYSLSLYNISLAYSRNNHIDSSYITIKEGLEETLKQQDTSLYNSFIFISGINAFKEKKYNEALNKINSAIPNLNSKTSQAIAHYYRGNILEKKQLYDEALLNYIKVDSLFKETNDEFPELSNAYKFLINHYKKEKDLTNQLYFIDRLLYTDSLIHKNQINLNSIITKGYDTPQLLKDKEEIISELNDKEKSSKFYLTIGLLLGVLLLGAFLISVIKNIKLQKRFNKLVENNLPSPLESNVEIELKKSNEKKVDIPENIVEEILSGLMLFEKERGYINKDISVNILSKRLKTNQNYLSKIINAKKNKNFSSYINDLRIDHVVERLKEDEKLRLYSLQAIAEEVGYNKYPPFYKAFVKRTGLKPSYFIEKLKNVKN